MKKQFYTHILPAVFLLLFNTAGLKLSAQYKSFTLNAKGDTLNIVDKNNLKQGKWLVKVPELRGEPGHDDEGFYKDNKKTGTWRRYGTMGDILAVENFKLDGKQGVQEYFTFLGEIQRHEEWKGYNPQTPYDTIPVYGQDNNTISSYKIIKATPYSVPHGEWRYYAAGGEVIKTEIYDRGLLLKEPPSTATAVVAAKPVADEDGKPTIKVKTQEILDYEKKYSKKKRKQMERDGHTGL